MGICESLLLMSGCHLLQMYRRIPFPGTSPPVLSLVIFIRVLSGRNYFVCFAIFKSKKIYKPAVEQKSSGMEWHYLWIIPCTFYLMWNYTIYGNANRSSLESAMCPGNVVFLFFITAGAFLIYSVVSKLVLEQQKIIELQTRNHQLSTQTLQYEKLQVFLTNIFFSVKILPSMQFFHIFPSRHVHLGSLTLFPLRFQNIFLFQRQIYPFYLEIFWKML